MPDLYSKLVEAKKGFVSDPTIPMNNELITTQPAIKKTTSFLEENRLSQTKL